MAEIKSTLELVMERTRHLTQSEEEKREQALAEFKNSLSGLIQKFRDGALRLDHFQKELRLLQDDAKVTDSGIIFDEVSRRLELDEDNAWAMAFLKEVFGINMDGVAAVSGEYLAAIDTAARKRSNEIRKDLEEKHEIRGGAVVPNLAADPEWAGQRQHLRAHFESLLAKELNKLRVVLPS